MSLTVEERGLRVLVLSADVGEGHVAAARALAEGLRAMGTVDVTVRDGLGAFGPVMRHVIRDGCRWQLRWMPWAYDGLYWLGRHAPPVRAVAARVLALADVLAERAHAEHEQQRQPEGERRLHDGERREQQRRGLQRPAEDAERGAGQPPRAAREARHERRAQAATERDLSRFDRLQRDAEVVHRGGRARGQRSEHDRRNGSAPR
jgi:hypothetical protein